MIKKLALIISVLPLLAACASNQTNTVSVSAPKNPNNEAATLTEAAASVSKSMVTLAQIEQAAHPLAELKPAPNPESYGMSLQASIDWSGPVGPLVEQLAQATHYRVRVLGTPPSIPILVTLSERNTSVADILRDTAYQCGKRADIVVLPESRIIEIRYETL